MGYASISGRARTSSKSPQAFAVCDRCGMWYNHKELQWQFDWGGASLINKRILVCRDCNDIPQNQLRAIVLPADPMPIINPRVEPWIADESNFRTTNQSPGIDPVTGLALPPTTYRITQSLDNRVSQQTGLPLGYANAVFTATLIPLSIISDGTTSVFVTCSAPHNMLDYQPVSILGSTNGAVDGLYSIVVTSATAFKYQIAAPVPAGGYLNSTTLVRVVDIGLPPGSLVVPQPGI